MPADEVRPPPLSANYSTGCSSRREHEEVAGWSGTFTQTDCSGEFMTSASWRDPDISFYGTAQTPAGARLQLQVYRTVRRLPAPAR